MLKQRVTLREEGRSSKSVKPYFFCIAPATGAKKTGQKYYFSHDMEQAVSGIGPNLLWQILMAVLVFLPSAAGFLQITERADVPYRPPVAD